MSFILRVTKAPTVAAGLIWPPEIFIVAVTARAKAKPFAKAAMKRFENSYKDIAAPIADPAPAKTKNKVPINSTNDLLKRLAWFEEELLDPVLYQ